MVCAKLSHPSSVPHLQQSRSSYVPSPVSSRCPCITPQTLVSRFQRPSHHLLLTPTSLQTMIGLDPPPPPSWILTLITIFLTFHLWRAGSHFLLISIQITPALSVIWTFPLMHLRKMVKSELGYTILLPQPLLEQPLPAPLLPGTRTLSSDGMASTLPHPPPPCLPPLPRPLLPPLYLP